MPDTRIFGYAPLCWRIVEYVRTIDGIFTTLLPVYAVRQPQAQVLKTPRQSMS